MLADSLKIDINFINSGSIRHRKTGIIHMELGCPDSSDSGNSYPTIIRKCNKYKNKKLTRLRRFNGKF